MSVENAEPRQEPTSQGEPTPRPPASPRPPVLRLRREAPQVRVFFSVKLAAIAAQDHPGDEFYDARRRTLKLVESDGGAAHLQATGDPVAELRERLITQLRRDLAVDASVPDEVEAILTWLRKAPSFEFLLYATTLGPVEYDDGDIRLQDPASPESRPCHDCNPIQQIRGTPPCCPR